MPVNRMYFDKTAVESGLMLNFVSTLTDMCYEDNDKLFNDIRIRPCDCGAFEVLWVQTRWDHAYGGKWEYVDENHEVCHVAYYEDGHCEYYPDWLEPCVESDD